MNIVYLTTQSYPVGMAGTRRVRLFSEHLAKANSVEVLVAGKSEADLNESGLYNGVRYQYFNHSLTHVFLGVWAAFIRLRARKASDQNNILICYDGISLRWLWHILIAKALGYYVVVDVVEDYSVHQEKTGFFLTMLHRTDSVVEKTTRFLADGVVVISSRLQTKLRKLGVGEERIRLISVSAENLECKLNKNANTSGLIKIVYSGSFGKKDGVSVLLQAFVQLLKRHQNLKLILSGLITEEVKNEIGRHQEIEYVGLVPDDEFYQFLLDADVLMMTRIDSVYANTGFPFKLGEYLATGNPVVTSRVSDIDEFLVDKVDAIIVEPSNVSSLVNGVEYFIANREKCKQVGENGRKKAEKYFNPSLNGKTLESFLKQITSRK